MNRKPIQRTGIAHASLAVKRKGERAWFDLFLPEGAAAFTSITAVAGIARNAPRHNAARPWQDGTAGHLALKWNRPGDVFHMQRVDLLETFGRDYEPMGLRHPGGPFWQGGGMAACGTRIAACAIRIPSDCRHVRGAYLDEVNMARSEDMDYTIDIFLTYTLEP